MQASARWASHGFSRWFCVTLLLSCFLPNWQRVNNNLLSNAVHSLLNLSTRATFTNTIPSVSLRTQGPGEACAGQIQRAKIRPRTDTRPQVHMEEMWDEKSLSETAAGSDSETHRTDPNLLPCVFVHKAEKNWPCRTMWL